MCAGPRSLHAVLPSSSGLRASIPWLVATPSRLHLPPPKPLPVPTRTPRIGFRAPRDPRWPHPRAFTGLHLQTPFFKQRHLYNFRGDVSLGTTTQLCTLTEPVSSASRLPPALERAKSSVPGQLMGQGQSPARGYRASLSPSLPHRVLGAPGSPVVGAGFQGVLGAALSLLVLREVPH